MLPITIAFVVTGLAVWVNALHFLGIGGPTEGHDPTPTVGVLTATAGLVDFVQAAYIIAVRPAPLGDNGVVVAGLLTFYAAFFTALGFAELKALDLRPIANLAVPVAIVPLFWWKFFDGSWMFHTILVVWLVAFLTITATVYGKAPAKALGGVLVITSGFTFFTPVILIALGHAIP
jgi:hypothetical protein